MKILNPLPKVSHDGGGTWINIKCPSKYQYVLEDVSDDDAGRTEDGVMHKNRIGQTIGVELQWNGLTTKELHDLLVAFNPEYITVKFIEPLSGNPNNNYFKELEVYVGNRKSPMYSASLNLWENLSLKIVDRKGVTKTAWQ